MNATASIWRRYLPADGAAAAFGVWALRPSATPFK